MINFTPNHQNINLLRKDSINGHYKKPTPLTQPNRNKIKIKKHGIIFSITW